MAILGGAAIWRWCGRSSVVRDVYAGTPYKNARAEVAYIGDAACTECHREIAEAYRSHPMGRSLAPIFEEPDRPPTTVATGLPFTFQELEYQVERQGGRTLQKATRRDEGGRVLGKTSADVRFALGSGTRGKAYLIERDGYLFQAPIAWFAQEGRWGISPGYGEMNPRPNFERVIQPECLFCHTNQVRHASDTQNRYDPPIFQGHAIGCERCHGPGALHVNRTGAAVEADFTIVNPRKLQPALRDAVCQQCHLPGWFRFPRAGREFTDFRPGLPLYRFVSVFVKTTETRERFELIGQVEQMESSRCFRGSDGKLGCISCHDPHRRPDSAVKAAYYRTRCLECHETKGCSLPEPERRSQGQGDDCIACHMPRSNVSSIPHLAETNHRIPRSATEPTPAAVKHGPGLPGALRPRDYHWALMNAEERRDGSRDMGVALESVARLSSGAPRMAKMAAQEALPLLESAVSRDAEDVRAHESLGYTFETLGRFDDARRIYEEILERKPGRELTLHSLARVLNRDQRPDLARLALEKVIAIDPWRSDYRLALGNVCAKAGDWRGAIAACAEAIRLNPELYEARLLLVQSHLRLNEAAKADAEFQMLLRFNPNKSETWQRWYVQQKQGTSAGIGARKNGKIQ